MDELQNEDVVKDEPVNEDIMEDSKLGDLYEESQEGEDVEKDEPNEDDEPLHDVGEKTKKKKGSAMERARAKMRIVESLSKKVLDGRLTFEDIADDPNQYWALPEVKTDVLLKQNQQAISIREKTKEEEDKKGADKIITQAWQERGYSNRAEFEKENPEFVEDFNSFYKKLGYKQASQQSLNNLIAREALDTNYRRQMNMDFPSPAAGGHTKASQVKKSVLDIGSFFGLTAEDFEKHNPNKRIETTLGKGD
jgi:hypothetical protein